MPFTSTKLLTWLLLFLAGVVAGAINAVAGGGSLISFPALMTAGIASVPANATNTVALWPGSLASVWGYRQQVKGTVRLTLLLTIPAIAGSLLGAWLLLHTPETLFRRVVPILILLATLLLYLQPRLKNYISEPHAGRQRDWLAFLMQIPVSIYGGYFGAGMGIMMLAVLGFTVAGNIHRLNAIKTWLAMVINIIAAIYFLGSNQIYLAPGIAVGIGAIVGGYGGALLSLKVKPDQIRYFVIAIGLILTVYFTVR